MKRRITLHLVHININHIDIDKDLFIKFPFTPRPCPAPPRPVLSYPALPLVFVFVFVFAFVLVYVFVFFLVIPFPLILLINCQKGRTALQCSLKSIRLKPNSLTDCEWLTDCPVQLKSLPHFGTLSVNQHPCAFVCSLDDDLKSKVMLNSTWSEEMSITTLLRVHNDKHCYLKKIASFQAKSVSNHPPEKSCHKASTYLKILQTTS